ncbi:ubiquitin-like modifier-activating enzyme ATG7 [Homalodisca vitripennis]|uniref:ubiquitin-like modifier-activating enzyme ATG7 n=1 Tax=Homalodisca vitripennis TaxID=197043 RepID=UPI001EE9DE6D|nr:ubiquitin-like modifier-activating enzyme ATG7 [Homalodisca vitripennis]
MVTCEKKLLQFVPFESCVEPTFWHKFTKLKLDVDMLEEKVRPIWGSYSPQYHRILNIDCTSFNKEFNYTANNWKAHGYHLNMNTSDSFKKHDKMKMLDDYGRRLRAAISSGEAIHCPSLLVNFIVLTFADLKKYHFYYWFAFIASAKPLCFLTEPTCELSNHFNNDQVRHLIYFI